MRFVQLEVEAFQGIERARVELGPGLNVLYGPNDLGKSTLATAIRAALLLLPKSSEAEAFRSWFRDNAPRVALTFLDDAGHTWQIKKNFGDGSSASAELLQSKDGRQFALAHRGREVDEKVRELLSWGIPAPGGKGAPRGLPESFLTNALLAAQTKVNEILAASLEKDPHESGKVRLQKALASLAQDPTFKRVFDVAQREFDTYFTATGRLRRTQGSKLVEADDAVKRHQSELDKLRQERERSHDVEEQVRKLNEARLEALSIEGQCQHSLNELRVGLANAVARRTAQSRLDDSQRKLTAIEKQVARLRALSDERSQLAEQVSTQQSVLATTGATCLKAEEAVRAAEDAQRAASSEQGEQARLLRVADLNTTLANHATTRAEIDAKREQLRLAESAQKKANDAARQVEDARTNEQKASLARETARLDLDKAERRRELARAVMAFGRWHVAAASSKEGEESRQRAVGQRADAQRKIMEALAHEQRALAAEAQIAARSADLPTADRLHELETRRHSLDLAEAALGGGLSIALRPRRALSLTATVDDGEQVRVQALDSSRTFEAERSLRLGLGDLVDIEVMAGAIEKRQAVERARTQWEEQDAPVLSKAGASSVAELVSAVRALRSAEAEASGWREQATRLRGDAQGLESQADILEQHAMRSTYTAEELNSLKAAIAIDDVKSVEASWRELGKNWEPEAKARVDAAQENVEAAASRGSERKSEQELAAYKLSQAERLATDLATDAAASRATIGGEQPTEMLAELERRSAETKEAAACAEASLRSLEQEASEALAQAARMLATAQTQLTEARKAHASAQSALGAARDAHSTKDGEHRSYAAQVEQFDQLAAVAEVAEHRAVLQNLPTAPLATETEVEAAEQALRRAHGAVNEQTEAFHKAEGALTNAGGAQLRERLHQMEEALDAARARERELEVDAKAWKLLRDSLRDAENNEGAHLGRALSGPVGERFTELTGGRYANLRFDQRLSAESLQATGASDRADVLDALSVGTRDQLATLVRMTIAAQLRSALILDDHLVHTDPARLTWFRQALMTTAVDTQVLVFTCRPDDYLASLELPSDGAVRDLAGGTMRAVDLAQVVQRWR